MPPKGKQATKGQKQIVEENKDTLKFYRYTFLIGTAFHLLVQLVFFWDTFTILHWFMLGIAIAMSFGSYQFMAYMAKATYGVAGNLLDGGIDLNMESGLAEHMKDLILLTAAVETAALITPYFWLFLLLAPGRAFYLLWVNILAPWIFAEAPEVDEKKQKKMERRMKHQQR